MEEEAGRYKGLIASMIELLIAGDEARRTPAKQRREALVERLRKGYTPPTHAVALARALRALVNAPLPRAEPLDPSEPFWVACREARDLLRRTAPFTGVDGEQER